jgi:hypothetical protein
MGHRDQSSEKASLRKFNPKISTVNKLRVIQQPDFLNLIIFHLRVEFRARKGLWLKKFCVFTLPGVFMRSSLLAVFPVRFTAS